MLTITAQTTPPPTILFTDIQSGPKTGGEGNNGVFVTIYGNNFGATRGTSTVTVGGGQVAAYRIWAAPNLWYQKIVVQLGPNAATGNIVVTTAAGSSNGVPFTVRTGNIYFASLAGSDSNNGSFATPFRTINKCKDALAAGDTCYVQDGVTATAQENYVSAVILGSAGTATAPRALLAYPGATATIGGDGMQRGLLSCANLGSCSNGTYWVVGGFQIHGQEMAADIQTQHITLVGNKFQCPQVGNGAASGCVQGETGSHFLALRGNEVTNVGAGGKLYHAVYLGADGHDYEVGWNSIHDVLGCRGLQIYSGSTDSYNISVHDNTVFNVRCDGLNLASVNPSLGFVNVYNNLVYHAGTGPDPSGGGANYSCLNLNDTGSSTAAVQVYNNTFADCGAPLDGSSGILSPSIHVNLRNNIIFSINNEPYFTGATASGVASLVTGSNNVWFGKGSGPSQTSGNLNSDPLFVNRTAANYHLQSGSPAKDAGIVIPGVTADHDGIGRPQGSAFDIGSLEFIQSSTIQQNPCDLNHDNVVTSSDADLASSQALGVTACGSADLNSDGVCNVVDVQRVVNAATGACRVGP